MEAALKRPRDTTTDLAVGHRAIRRKLNDNVPSIIVGSAGDQDNCKIGNNTYTNSNCMNPAQDRSPNSDIYIPMQSLPSSFHDPLLLNPAPTHGLKNQHQKISQRGLSPSPSLSPTGIQLLSLDSDIEMEIDSQTEDDFDLDRQCVMELNPVTPGNELQHKKCDTTVYNGLEKPETAICFGMIFAMVQLSHEMNHDEQWTNTGKGFDILRRKRGYYVLLSPLTFKEIGVVDLETERCLQIISDVALVQLKGHILSPEISEGGCNLGKRQLKKTNTGPGKEMRHITITIYGSLKDTATVGKILSSKKKYLQMPDHIDSEHVYRNPHEYKRLRSEHEPSIMRFPPLVQAQHTAEDGNLITNILDSITPRVALVEDDAADCISTPLLSHQKEALCFTRQQESRELMGDSLWEKRQRGAQYIYSHKIINMSQADMPSTLCGGILADDMGLGKTLTMLATMVRSFSEARSLAPHQGSYIGRTGVQLSATLVILPLSLMAEWENEITKHIIPGTVRYHKYHGQAKMSLEQLVHFDIVFTTYNTLSAEFTRGGSPLFMAIWFRVVLDEAHIIRNRETKIYRAVTSLSTQRRWCLTGTPTQNRLGDLFSLFMFLKIPQFEKKATLKRYIVNPLKENDMKGADNLRTLLAACCLRRRKCTLPQSIAVSEIPRLLEMSFTEINRYQRIKEDCQKVVDMHVCSGRSSKAYLSILQTITHLRLLCNHGIQLRIPSPKTTMHDPHGHVMDVDRPQEEAIDPADLLESLETMDKDTCAKCDIKIVSLVDNIAGAGSLGYLTRCSYLICVACIPQVFSPTGRDGKEQYCHLCQEVSDTSHVHNFDNTAAEFVPGDAVYACNSPEGANQGIAIPTKIFALLADIEDNPAREKSIVFSGWTKTLDLVESHLRDRKIDFRRVDGKVNSVTREATLEDFRTNPDILVLLLTTGCGAVGLNLTAARRVHIIEPQWNPMVEKQAIGRVVRFGQSQQVSIFRYIMKGTIEESMVSRQFQKTQLAELISSAGDRSTKDMVSRMKNLRQLI